MGRDGSAACPDLGAAVRPRAVGSAAGRVVAVVLASLALLLCGAVEVLPRSAAAASSAGAAAAAPPGSGSVTSASRSPRAGSLESPAASLAARAAGLAGVGAPTGPSGGLPPGDGPLVAPHLVADPQSRPPTAPLVSSAAGAPGSRAPPGPAGT